MAKLSRRKSNAASGQRTVSEHNRARDQKTRRAHNGRRNMLHCDADAEISRTPEDIDQPEGNNDLPSARGRSAHGSGRRNSEYQSERKKSGHRAIKRALGGRPHPHLGEDFAGRFGAGANAVGDADAAIAVACERQTGKFLAKCFDALQALEVADRILRHGGLPFVDARKQRFGIEGSSNDLPQFAANDFENFCFARLQDLLVARAAEKAADKGTIFRCAVRKFVVDEGGREHTAALAARHQKSEAWWKRATHLFIVTERNGHRRAVL